MIVIPNGDMYLWECHKVQNVDCGAASKWKYVDNTNVAEIVKKGTVVSSKAMLNSRED